MTILRPCTPPLRLTCSKYAIDPRYNSMPRPRDGPLKAADMPRPMSTARQAAGSRTADRAAPAGRTYYFCCPSCRDRFQAAPQRYLGGAPARPAPAPPPAAAVYVCPMHPDVRQDHPGSCPKCGMALEPRAVTLEEGPN